MHCAATDAAANPVAAGGLVQSPHITWPLETTLTGLVTTSIRTSKSSRTPPIVPALECVDLLRLLGDPAGVGLRDDCFDPTRLTAWETSEKNTTE